MPSTANEVINVRERPLSTDINDLQSLIGRDLLDLLRYGQMRRVIGSPTNTVKNAVLGGLVPSASGADISISIGALLQDSATLAPVPGALDSQYRIGILRSAATVTPPTPGSTTYYLLEAQMVEVTTVTESRDVLDSGTGIFTPQSVPKQRVRSVQFQLVAGTTTNAPAPTGGDWVPIAIIRRPGGGGPLASSDVIDVRQFADWGRELPASPAALKLYIGAAALTNQITINALVDGPGRERTAVQVLAGVDITAATILSPATSLSANGWFYLYLAPWAGSSGINPRVSSGTSILEGVLVLSDVAPSTSRLNTADIALPAPYAISDAPTGSAYCVAALRRNSANTAWIQQWTGDGTTWRTAPLASPIVSPATPNANNLIDISGLYPPCATEVMLQIVYEQGGVGANITLSVRDGFDLGAIEQFYVDDAVAFNDSMKTSILTALLNSDEFILYPATGGALLGSLIYARVVGWKW